MDKKSNTATKKTQTKRSVEKSTEIDAKKPIINDSDKKVVRSSSVHTKKRSVVSYKNLSPELLAEFKEKYPKGYADYMSQIFKVDKPDGTFFYAVSLDLEDAVYLVKIDVKIDDYEDAEADIFGSDDGADVASDDTEEFPDEDTSGYVDEEESDN